MVTDRQQPKHDARPKSVQLDALSKDKRFRMGMLFAFVVITSPMGIIGSAISTGMAATGKASWLLPLAIITVGLILPGLLLAHAMRGIRRTQVRVGDDGVALDAEYRRSHFIRYEQLRRAFVDETDKTLRLELRDGPVLDVPISDETIARTVVEQIEAARSKPRHDVHVDELHALDRGQLTWAAWQKRLSSLLNTQGDYRDRGLDAQ